MKRIVILGYTAYRLDFYRYILKKLVPENVQIQTALLSELLPGKLELNADVAVLTSPYFTAYIKQHLSHVTSVILASYTLEQGTLRQIQHLEQDGPFSVVGDGNLVDSNRKMMLLEKLGIRRSSMSVWHSGMEIHNQRANAIKILSRILYYVKNDINIHSISGGSKRNAIAKNSEAIITSNNMDKVKASIEEISQNIKNEYKIEDPDMKISISKCDNIKECFTKELTNNVIDFLMLTPDGVLYMSRDIEGLVQTSANNGVLKEENGKLNLVISIRSCVESSSREIVARVEDIALRTNAHFKASSGYPAWQYDPNSKIKDVVAEVYKKVTGKDAEMKAIHAGLECGTLKKPLPNVDMISIGPNIYDVHTPKEHLSISSVDRMWKFLKELIINIK